MPNFQLHRPGDRNLLDEVSGDIYGINETLGITAVGAFLYDTTLDSDNGAWRYNTDHTSWAKEDRSTGVYLGALADETAARAAGGTTGDYYYATGAAAFYELSAGSGQALTYRGGSQRFPATAMITLEDLTLLDRVTIWDASDGSMWKVLSIDNNTSDVSMSHGQLSVSQDTAGVIVWDFLVETLVRYTTQGKQSQPWASAVAGSSFVTISGSLTVVNQSTNCITQTVLPNAPLDAVTGLPLVTTVVGTDGGLTILDGPAEVGGPPVKGNAVDITYTLGTGIISFLAFREDGALIYASDNSIQGKFVHVRHSLPVSDVSQASAVLKGTSDEHYSYLADSDLQIHKASGPNTHTKSLAGNAVAKDDQINFIQPNRATPAEGSQVIMKEDSISPVMTGATLGAWMASTDATVLSGADIVGAVSSLGVGWTDNGDGTFTSDGTQTGTSLVTLTTPSVSGTLYKLTLVVTSRSAGFIAASLAATGSTDIAGQNADGTYTAYVTTTIDNSVTTIEANADFVGTAEVSLERVDADVSPNENHLDVTGSLTRTAVATGSDLVGYSGFSASNYAELANIENYLTSVDDFTLSCWVTDPSTFDTFFTSENASDVHGFLFRTDASGFLFARTIDAASASILTGTTDVRSIGWFMATFTVSQSGTDFKIYLNGDTEATATVTARDLSSMSGAMRIGALRSSGGVLDGSIALTSLTDRALTAEQIATKYNIERWWFQPNTTVTLDSSVVRDMAYDKALKRYHVLTDTGHSVFDAQSFTRLEYTAGDWDTIAVDDGRVAKG